jgi:hypothetical protein
MKGVINMKKQNKLTLVLNVGCTFYDWSHIIDPRIKKICDENNISVVIAPNGSKFKYYIEIIGMLCYTDSEPPIIVIDLDFYDMNQNYAVFEFSIWHEICHIINNTDNELECDMFAFEQMMPVYGRIGACAIYGRLLELVYKYNRSTKTWDDTNIKNGYIHRKEDLMELTNFMTEYPYD